MKTHLSKQGKAATVKLVGALNEGANKELSSLLPRLEALHVTFDLAEISSINSIGFRTWMTFLKRLATLATFELRGCSPDYVDYCNLLPITSLSMRVVSVTVPYRCDSCRALVLDIVEVEALPIVGEFAIKVCEQCHGVLEAEVSLTSYLAFKGERGQS